MTKPASVFKCTGCGHCIGDGQLLNAVYFCDRDEGQWCGKCFDDTSCGKGDHGEGCPTLMACPGPGEEHPAHA